MRQILRLHFCFLILVAASFFVTSTSWAEGSLLWSQVRAEIAKNDPFLSEYITKTFDVSPVGTGIRVGHDDKGNSLVPGLGVGQRIPPYEFYAKPIGTAGDYTLSIKLEPVDFETDKVTLWTLTLRKRRSSD